MGLNYDDKTKRRFAIRRERSTTSRSRRSFTSIATSRVFGDVTERLRRAGALIESDRVGASNGSPTSHAVDFSRFESSRIVTGRH